MNESMYLLIVSLNGQKARSIIRCIKTNWVGNCMKALMVDSQKARSTIRCIKTRVAVAHYTRFKCESESTEHHKAH